MNHDELAERVASALEIDSESEKTKELDSIGAELLADFVKATDSSIHGTLLYIQESIDKSDTSVEGNPFHHLMGVLGESQELFDRMTIYVPTVQAAETTADDS